MTTEDDQQKAEALLKGAYALKTADDNVEYYRDFAPIYDSQFVDGMGYCYPRALATVFATYARPDDQPVVDIGCGTGLVAIELHNQIGSDNALVIDGIDISADMLQVARQKNSYRELYELDLTQSAGDLVQQYGSIVSAGTFTHGHLGPAALELIMQIARKDALFCIGVNSQHYQQQGFEAQLEKMAGNGQITTPRFDQVEIYSSAESEHAGDTATVLVYRKC